MSGTLVKKDVTEMIVRANPPSVFVKIFFKRFRLLILSVLITKIDLINTFVLRPS